MFIVHVYAVLCFTVVKHGRCLACRRKFNYLYLQNLRRIFRIAWQQKTTKKKVLRRNNLTTMYFTPSQHRIRCLGHVIRMDQKRTPKCLYMASYSLTNAIEVAKTHILERIQARPKKFKYNYWWVGVAKWRSTLLKKTKENESNT